MTRKKWGELSPRTRRLIIGVGVFDLVLRLLALLDLTRRPPSRVNGSKLAWGVGLGVVNSAGVLPIVYFIAGRRDD